MEVDGGERGTKNELIVDVIAGFIMENIGDEKEEMIVTFPFVFLTENDWNRDYGVFDVSLYIDENKIGYTENPEEFEIFR